MRERRDAENETKKRSDFVQLLVDAKVDKAEVLKLDSCSSFDQLEAAKESDDENSETETSSNFTSKSLTGLSETEIIAQGIFFYHCWL